MREQLVHLLLGQFLGAQQAGPEFPQAVVAAEQLADARHQLEPARVEVAGRIELLQRLQRGLVLAAAHLHLGERDQRRGACLRCVFLRARQPLVAPIGRVEQVGGTCGGQVVGRRRIGVRCRAAQQFLGALPLAGRELEQAARGFVAGLAQAPLRAQLGHAAPRRECAGERDRGHVHAGQQQHEDRQRGLEQRAAEADRHVAGVDEQQVRQQAADDQDQRDDCRRLHGAAVLPRMMPCSRRLASPTGGSGGSMLVTSSATSSLTAASTGGLAGSKYCVSQRFAARNDCA